MAMLNNQMVHATGKSKNLVFIWFYDPKQMQHVEHLGGQETVTTRGVLVSPLPTHKPYIAQAMVAKGNPTARIRTYFLATCGCW